MSSFLGPVEKIENDSPALPPVGPDRAAHRLLLDLGRHQTLRPALAIDHLILILYLHSNIEVYKFQAEVAIDS